MTAHYRHPFDIVTRVLAERLRGCEPSDELRALVHSRDIAWDSIVGQASEQFALPALAAALRDLGLIDSLDGELAAFLQAVHAANLERNRGIGDELRRAVAALNRAGLEPVLLKGAIRLVEPLYPDHGWRMLRDLDLLITDTALPDAIAALARVGYTLTRQSWQEAVLQRDGAPVIIELHRELFPSSSQARLLPGVEVLNGARRIPFGEATIRLPSIDHQIGHLIGHSQIGHSNYAYGRIALCDRLEAAALLRWGSASVDWTAVYRRFATAGYARPLLVFLLSLRDGGLCTVPLPGRTDPLTMLQERRVAFQARSRAMGCIGLWVGRLATKLRSQIMERDAGRLRAVKNINRLLFERGAARQMVRTFLGRTPHAW